MDKLWSMDMDLEEEDSPSLWICQSRRNEKENSIKLLTLRKDFCAQTVVKKLFNKMTSFALQIDASTSRQLIYHWWRKRMRSFPTLEDPTPNMPECHSWACNLQCVAIDAYKRVDTFSSPVDWCNVYSTVSHKNVPSFLTWCRFLPKW